VGLKKAGIFPPSLFLKIMLKFFWILPIRDMWRRYESKITGCADPRRPLPHFLEDRLGRR